MPTAMWAGLERAKGYLHAWRLRLVVVKAGLSAHKAAHLFDNFFSVLDELIEVYEHHAAGGHHQYCMCCHHENTGKS